MDPSSPEYALLLEAMSLGPAEARALEEQVAKAPEDNGARSKLVAYYGHASIVSKAAGEAQEEHVLWLIQHAPGELVLRTPLGALEARRAEGEAAWREQLAAYPSAPAVHAAAAIFFRDHDDVLADRLQARAKELDPKGDWEWQAFPGGEVPRPRRRTVEQLEVELARETDALFRFYLVSQIVKAALAAGDSGRLRCYGQEVLDLASRFPGDWNHGNGRFEGHTALGILAVESEDMEAAVLHLLASAATPGSPQLGSFGPDFTLAQQLLARGQREAVTLFLERCQSFWEMGRGRLHFWLEELRAGETPDLLVRG